MLHSVEEQYIIHNVVFLFPIVYFDASDQCNELTMNLGNFIYDPKNCTRLYQLLFNDAI